MCDNIFSAIWMTLLQIGGSYVSFYIFKKSFPNRKRWSSAGFKYSFYNKFKILGEVSAIKPILDSNNVKLVGVGLEELGVQDFIDGKFFDGGKQKHSSYSVADVA